MLQKKNLFFLFFLNFIVYTSISHAEDRFSAFILFDDNPLDSPVWVIYSDEQVGSSKIQLGQVREDLVNYLNTETMNCLSSSMNEEGFVSFLQVKNCSLTLSVDLNTLNVTISLAREVRKKNVLSVSGSRGTKREKKVITPRGYSGYLNARGLQEFRSSDFDSGQSSNATSGDFEGVLNMRGLVFENRFNYLEENIQSGSRWSRDYTRLVWDKEDLLTRFALGDVEHSTRGFQDRILGTGFSVSREFSIDPYFFRSSFRKFDVYVERAGNLEIYVNGRLIKRQRVSRGPLELSDFPFISGENAVRIKIVDDFGGIKEVDFANIADSRLLSNGVQQFGLSFIFPRRVSRPLLDFEEDYDFDEGILTGFYQVGIRNNLSIGLEGQASENRGTYGIESTYGGIGGLTKLNFAGSYDRKNSKDGFVARLENESLLMKKGKIRRFRLISGIEYKTREFETFQNSLGDHRLLIRSSVGQNFKNNIRGSLGFSKSWAHETNEEKTFIFSNFGWNFARNWDLSSALKMNLDDGEERSVLISLTWYSPVRNNQWISTFDPVNISGNTEFSTFPLEGRDNLWARVGADNAEDFQSVNFGADFFNQRYELRGNHASSLSGSSNSNTTNVSSVSLGMGLAFVGSHVSVARPINNSFALIGMSNKPKGLKVPINRFGRSRRAEINSWGPASLTTLAPYYTDRVAIDVSALPYGLSIENENFEFRPSYKSGIYLDAKVEGQISLSGLIQRKDGGSVSYLTGELYELGPEGSKVVSEFFTGVGGDFIVENVKAKSYLMKFSDEAKIFKSIKVEVENVIGIFQISNPLILEEEVVQNENE